MRLTIDRKGIYVWKNLKKKNDQSGSNMTEPDIYNHFLILDLKD